jgi:2-methylcitrate dehydratase PrpD
MPRRGWSDAVDHEAHRTFYNWLGCAIGAAQHEAAQAALQAVQPAAARAAQATVLGRTEQVDMASAALVNGITSHTFDFDDTHLKTIIHPAGPVASAVLALAEHRGAVGPRGDRRAGAGHRRGLPRGQRHVPRPLRPGLAHHRLHRHAGCGGGLRAAAALNEQQTAMALGIAASQPVGLREQFGTMTKPFHPGRRGARGADVGAAGQPGLHRQPAGAGGAARLHPGGISTSATGSEITGRAGPALRDLVQHLQAVCLRHRHPPQHRRLRAAARSRASRPSRWSASSLRVHSLVLELTGKKEPKDGLQGKFSVYHGCAAGLIYGRAGEEEFHDAVVNDPRVVATACQGAMPSWTTPSTKPSAARDRRAERTAARSWWKCAATPSARWRTR